MLQENFLAPLGLSAYRLAKDIGVPQTRIAAILHGRRAVSADTAARLARYFRTSAEFWLNLQSAYDLEEVERRNGAEIARIEPRRDDAAAE